MLVAYPEAEGAAKAWVRSTGLVGNRAFLGLPARVSAWPVVVVVRAGLGPLRGLPVDHALIQLEVWGAPPAQGARGGQDRYAVAAVATALAGAADSLAPGTPMGTGVVSAGAEVTRGPVWSPDPDDGQSRYLLDVAFLIRLAA